MPKNVIITAGAGGIGRSIANKFSGNGDRVFVCDIDKDALESLKLTSPAIQGRLANVADPKSVEEFFAEAMDHMGGVDVLINNAGIGGPRAAIEDIDYDDWRLTVDVNLSAQFYCIKQIVPTMKKQKSGSIINLSTGSSRVGMPNRLPYVAAKAGVNGLTYNVARELGPFNIRCNAILPGAVEGPRSVGVLEALAKDRGQTFEEVKAECLQYISMRTEVSPDDVADMALFLASDGARHVSGQLIGVCGNIEWEA